MKWLIVLVVTLVLVGCQQETVPILKCPSNAPYFYTSDRLCHSIPQDAPRTVKNTTTAPQPKCPASCNDNNKCTTNYCNNSTNFQCRYKPIVPCCGNSKCEQGEDYSTCPEDCQKPVDAVTSASVRA